MLKYEVYDNVSGTIDVNIITLVAGNINPKN